MTDTFILQELITEDLPFRVHNVKIDKFIAEQDLPMMFLAHYDSLSDDIKAQKPLDIHLLKRMNDEMTAAEACQVLGLPQGTIKPATHIKITGTSVIVLDEFPLALHLQFTNTAKPTQSVYGNNLTELITTEAKNYALAGNVHILHKNSTKRLISIDLNDETFVINQNDSYTRLPNTHAMATTHTLNTLKSNTPQALFYLNEAVVQKVLEYLKAC